MARATAEQLARLQAQPNRIRNLCVLAHVDHGKTTLSDSLVSSNGLISTKSVGKVRYMDYLPEEQERGITMKSSSISLYYKYGTEDTPYLINLIDSPGHVDFSFEVSTAVRLTDGALVVVDVVEGVCIQTETVLRQAYADRVRPVLVLNKIDRLFNERHLSAEEAYYHLRHVLEQVNGIAGELFKESQLRATLAKDALQAGGTAVPAPAAAETPNGDAANNEVQLEGTAPDEADEIYFSPTTGNVIFASAYDCWGFRTSHFAEAYAKKLNIRKELLLQTLWGEFYFSAKAKRIYTKAQNDMAPMFVQFCLKNIWDVYQAVMVDKDAARIEKIAKVLNVKLQAKDMNVALRDPKTLLSGLMGQWLPLSDAVLAAAVEHLPSPLAAAPYRLPVICRSLPPNPSAELVTAHKPIYASLTSCNPSGPVVVFISKVFAVPRDQIVVPRRAFVARPRTPGNTPTASGAPAVNGAAETAEEREVREREREAQAQLERERANEEVFVGLGRVFSGTLRRGQRIHVLGPRYSPSHPDEYRAEMDASELYLLMGRALEPIEEVPAGNVFGISGPGVENLILKTATLSESPFCTTFAVLRMSAAPIVRVAVEPRNATERVKLADGLRRLEHSDPLCTVAVLDSGEHVVAAAGELHLERCLKDLRERFARIDFVVSPPLFSFRESIVSDPRRDKNTSLSVEQFTANRLVSITVRAAPLRTEIARFLDDNTDLIRRVCSDDTTSPSEESDSAAAIDSFRIKFMALLSEAGLASQVSSLWAFGPKRCGPNLLFCSAPVLASLVQQTGAAGRLQLTAVRGPSPVASPRALPAAAENVAPSSVQTEADVHAAELRELGSAIVAGFQVATAAGPLCAEPVTGVAFFIESVGWHEDQRIENEAHGLALSGQVISAAKEACKQAFLKHSPRLVEPYFLCDIQVHSDSLGKLHSVLGRRRAKIFKEEPKEGTHVFTVQAHLPVAESIGFSEELLKKTSGSAYPQLMFSHWDILEQDPYWAPTEEQLEEHGDNASAVGLNVARRLMDDVRRRKGLFVEEKIVEHADKQRTLGKNK